MFTLPKFLKKIIVSFLVFIVLFLSFSGSVKAQTSWYTPSYQEFSKKVNDGGENAIFGERYTQAQVWWIIWSLFSFIREAPIPEDIKPCVKITDLPGFMNCIKESPWIKGIAASSSPQKNIVELILEDRPISAITYFKDVGKRIKLVPEVNAQTGFGFTALNPILMLWKGARDITYGLMVIAIIALSFMVMFKVKLNPQTSITIQSAIPKVVIALILITFSYAIAGLLIDLMFVAIGIISAAMYTSKAWSTLPLAPQTPVDFFNLLTRGPAGFTGIFGFVIRYWVGFIVTMIAITLSAATASLVFTFLGGFLGTILSIISILILLYNAIRVIFMLFKALAQVLLGTIFAPFQILLGVVIPGAGFGGWLRSYISNLVVFPITGLLFVLASLFLAMALSAAGKGIINNITTFSAAPTGIAAGWPPLLGTGDPETTTAIIFLGTSFVIMTIIPKTVELIQALIKGQPFNYGAALSEATISPFANAIKLGSTIGEVGKIITTQFGTKNPNDPNSGIITGLRTNLQKGTPQSP